MAQVYGSGQQRDFSQQHQPIKCCTTREYVVLTSQSYGRYKGPTKVRTFVWLLLQDSIYINTTGVGNKRMYGDGGLRIVWELGPGDKYAHPMGLSVRQEVLERAPDAYEHANPKCHPNRPVGDRKSVV